MLRRSRCRRLERDSEIGKGRTKSREQLGRLETPTCIDCREIDTGYVLQQSSLKFVPGDQDLDPRKIKIR